MPRGHWTSFYLEALRHDPVIEIGGVVKEHLGRPATRAERMASRRAAGMLATSGEAVRLYLPKAARNGRQTPHLFLARPRSDEDAARPSPLDQAYAQLCQDLLEAAADAAPTAHRSPVSVVPVDETGAAAVAV